MVETHHRPHARPVALITFSVSWYMVGGLERYRDASAARVAKLTLGRGSFEHALDVTRLTGNTGVGAGEREAGSHMIEVLRRLWRSLLGRHLRNGQHQSTKRPADSNTAKHRGTTTHARSSPLTAIHKPCCFTSRLGIGIDP